MIEINENKNKGIKMETLYKPDTSNLNNVPSCDIFGYLMASMGKTKNTDSIGITNCLMELKKIGTVYPKYIDSILVNIIEYGDIEDYMEHLTDNKNEFVTCDGDVVKVEDLSWL